MKIKKILAVILCSVMLISATGCVGKMADEISAAGNDVTAGEVTGEAGTTLAVTNTIPKNPDGVTLDTAPIRLGTSEPHGVHYQTFSVEGKEYWVDPANSYINQIVDGRSDTFRKFDALYVYFISNGGIITDVSFKGTIDGVELKGKDYIQALTTKQPEAKITYSKSEQITNELLNDFDIYIQNLNAISIFIYQPSKNELYGKLNISFNNIINSNINNSLQDASITYDTIENTLITSNNFGSKKYIINDHYDVVYKNIRNCSIFDDLFADTTELLSPSITITYTSGERNDLYIYTSDFKDNCTKINIDSIYASNMKFYTIESSMSIVEDSYNFNSEIILEMKSKDLETQDLNYYFSTKEGDECPVILKCVSEHSYDNTKIETDGTLEHLDNYKFRTIAKNVKVWKTWGDITPPEETTIVAEFDPDTQAKLTFQSAASYATKVIIAERHFTADVMTGNLNEKVSQLSSVNTDIDEESMQSIMQYYMGGEDGGYYVIQFDDKDNPIFAYWSTSMDSTEVGAYPQNEHSGKTLQEIYDDLTKN
ncbi:MAG: hypothetical protein LBL87_01330 [Ruminococcus sp.]|nr:hypothetical protein [Ruminococcus sp.]